MGARGSMTGGGREKGVKGEYDGRAWVTGEDMCPGVVYDV